MDITGCYLLTVLVIMAGNLQINSQGMSNNNNSAWGKNSSRDRKVHNLETELSKLRMMQQVDREQRILLEREINHYQMIMQGIGLLCKTTHGHMELLTPPIRAPPPPATQTPMVSGISAHQVTSIITPLGGTAVVHVTVTYSTTETHDIIWAYNVLGHMVPVRDGDPYSSVRHESNGESFTTTLYIGVYDLERLELLYVKIISEFSEITLLFNKASLLSGGSTELTPLNLWKDEPSPEVLVLNADADAKISTRVETHNDKLVSFVNFIGIDTSVYPNRLLDLKGGDNKVVSSIVRTASGFHWTIILDKSLVNAGGMLSIRLIEQIKHGTVLQIHTGKTVYIIPDKLNTPKEPFPPKSLALLSLYKNTRHVVTTKSPVGAIWCYAFGNPTPQTTIIKVERDGRRRTLKGHVYNIGQYDSAQVVIVRNVTVLDQGQYICQASSGIKTMSRVVYLNVTTGG